MAKRNKNAANIEPFYRFPQTGKTFKDMKATPGMEKAPVSDIGVESQHVPTVTTRNSIGSSKGATMKIRESDGVKRIKESLVHDKRKGIEDTMFGGPAYFRSEQIERLRGFNQAKTPDSECGKIKHRPVHSAHDPFWQKHQSREKQ